MPSKLRTALITLISVVWAINFLMPVFQHTYKPPAEINLAFMGVVGLLTAGYGGDKKVTVQPPPPEPEPSPAPVAKAAPRKKPVKKAAGKKTAAKKAGKKIVKKQPGKKGGGRR